jgi:hypothetical protein
MQISDKVGYCLCQIQHSHRHGSILDLDNRNTRQFRQSIAIGRTPRAHSDFGINCQPGSNFFKRSLPYDLSTGDDRDTIRQLLRFMNVMSRQEHRPAFRAKLPQPIVNRSPAMCVDTGCRLVQEDNRRIVDHRQNEGELLFLATR